MDPQLGSVARGAEVTRLDVVDLGPEVGGCAARVARRGGGCGARLGALVCGAELGALIRGAERGVIQIRAAAVIFSRTLFLSLPSIGSFSPST
jgi:hypothetical protein